MDDDPLVIRPQCDHLLVRLGCATADAPDDDGAASVDVGIDHLPLSMHDAPAREHSGLDRALYVDLSEGQHRSSRGCVSLRHPRIDGTDSRRRRVASIGCRRERAGSCGSMARAYHRPQTPASTRHAQTARAFEPCAKGALVNAVGEVSSVHEPSNLYATGPPPPPTGLLQSRPFRRDKSAGVASLAPVSPVPGFAIERGDSEHAVG